jgi:glycosyltransferase involved in cell wall biosynthesis
LFAFPQDPFDWTSGAAVSTRLLARAAAGRRNIRPTVCAPAWREGTGWLTAAEFRKMESIPPAGADGDLVEFSRAGVEYRILCAPREGMRYVDAHGMAAMVYHWDQAFVATRPEVLLCYGSSPGCRDFRARVRAAGKPIAFLAHNEFFTTDEQILPADLLVCPSRFIGIHLAKRFNLPFIVCPPIVDLDETVPAARDPVFATFVNPQPIKGVHLFAGLVAETLARGMDCPFLVVGGRAGLAPLHEALRRCGIFKEAEAVVTVMERTRGPADFLRFTRCLLAPSLHEAAGRVVAEALACGIPCLVSNRGGLPETAGGGGRIVPIPPSVTAEREHLPDVVIRPWADELQRLLDPRVHQSASARAEARGAAFCHPELISPMIDAIGRLRAFP